MICDCDGMPMHAAQKERRKMKAIMVIMLICMHGKFQFTLIQCNEWLNYYEKMDTSIGEEDSSWPFAYLFLAAKQISLVSQNCLNFTYICRPQVWSGDMLMGLK